MNKKTIACIVSLAVYFTGISALGVYGEQVNKEQMEVAKKQLKVDLGKVEESKKGFATASNEVKEIRQKEIEEEERRKAEEEARRKAEEEARRKAEEEARLAEEAQWQAQEQAQEQYSEPVAQQQPQDNIWHVSYSRQYGVGSAPADGSVMEWAQGWFAAHRGMWGGEMIASCPPYVEVDGRVYKFAYSWVDDDDIYEEDVRQVRADNGISFQTCITETTNLMVHYVPVGAGYPYSWEIYPYVTTDGEYIGFWREDYYQ